MGTFLAVAFAAYASGFLVSNLTSIILVKTFIEPGFGRQLVNAELFRVIWSWGFNRPGLGLVKVVAALFIAWCCLSLFTGVGAAFLAACVAGSVLAAVGLTVVFFNF